MSGIRNRLKLSCHSQRKRGGIGYRRVGFMLPSTGHAMKHQMTPPIQPEGGHVNAVTARSYRVFVDITVIRCRRPSSGRSMTTSWRCLDKSMATITASADVELSLVMVGLSSKCRFDNFTLLTRWPLMIALMTPAGAKVPFFHQGGRCL